jgi:TonB-dependent starch-binding outer membrane protein SusC
MTARKRVPGLLCLLLLVPAANGTAQPPADNSRERVAEQTSIPTSLLERQAGLSVAYVELERALLELTERAAVPLAFSPARLPRESRVTCRCEEVTVGEALNRLLRGTTLRFAEVANQIVLYQPPDGGTGGETGATGTSSSITLVNSASLGRLETRNRRSGTSRFEARQGTIAGSVTDQGGDPIPGVRVVLVGTQRAADTDPSGRFEMAGVPAGEHRVRASALGYRSETRTVSVASGATATVEIRLVVSALALDEIIVTGRGTGTARREIGSSVARIDTDALEAAPITSMSNLLQARAPGVHILASGGQPGQGSRILLRGIASLSQSNTPVIYVDGVRMDNSPFRGIRTTGPSWAGFDDINPADIENIEIIRGASAATLYGTEAAAGVINITTRRGLDGRATWRLRSEVGTSRVPESYWAESGSVFSGWYHQNMAQSGSYLSNQVSVRGGTDGFSYYASGTLRDHGGIEPNSQEEYGAFRTNLSLRATDDLTLSVSTGYTSREVMTPPQGNNQEGFLINGLLAAGDGHFTPTEPLRQLEMFQRGYRFTGGASAEWTPGQRWIHRLTLGGDFFNSDNTEYLPPEIVARFGGGYAGNYRRIAQNVNLDLASTFATDLTGAVRSSTTGGIQWFQAEAGIQRAYGEDFAFRGLRVVDATSSSFQAGESRSEERMLGVFLEQQLGWNDRLYVTVGARADGHSAFGEEVDFELYPKVDVSYVLSEHAFWNPGWGSLRLRGAYGTAGMQPGAFSAVRTYGAVSGAGGLPAIVASNVGNPELRPEVSHELEVGFDADVLDQRLGAEFTFYDQTTRDALFQARNIPSMGVLGTQLRNVGEVSNRGIELAVNATLIQLPGFRWVARASMSTNENEVVSLSGEAPLTVRWLQHIREGFPIAGFFASNHLIEVDGQVVNKQELCADYPAAVAEDRAVDCTDAEQYIGPAQPTRTVQLGSDLSIGERTTIGVSFDHHGGHYRHDHTMRWLMDPRRNVGEERAEKFGVTPGPTSQRCRDAPENSLDEAICGRNSLLSHGEFAVPADFWRLREVTLAYRLPEAWMSRIGMSSGRVTLAGRNLWRSQKSPGLEPESNLDSQSSLQRHSFFPTPIPQQFVLGFTFDF